MIRNGWLQAMQMGSRAPAEAALAASAALTDTLKAANPTIRKDEKPAGDVSAKPSGSVAGSDNADHPNKR